MGKKVRVMVIDDSPIIFKMVRKAVEPAGFEVVGHAENGLEGLSLYDELLPDIVTLDVTMPIMDGMETAEKLFAKHPDANVILLSAMGDEDLIEQGKSVGLKHFLTKPVKADVLVREMSLILGI